MEAWLYDEDRWPSGFAGGLVTQYPEYRAKLMTMHTFKPSDFKPDKKYTALFSCRLDSLDCYDIKKITAIDIRRQDAEYTILAFFVRDRDGQNFYNGFTDVDRMSREATDYFIQITHEEYKKRCGDRLGNSINGVFTDEPHRQAVIDNERGGWLSVLDSEDRYYVPWTGKFAEEFRKRMGYDIMEKLPELFYRPDGESVTKVKWDYMETTQQLFLENWVIPCYDWCEDNNMILTGHFLHEDELRAQAAMQGSLMRSYEYMHYPGIDLIRLKNLK